MKRFVLRAIPALVILNLVATNAHAEPKEARDAARARAASWFKSGVERARANDFEGARTSFAAAYAVVPSTDILWNLAVAERRSGKPIDALTHLKAYVGQTNARADRVPQAEEWIKELESETGRIVFDAPAGSEITLDGVALTEKEVRVVAGVHAVMSRRDGRAFSVAVDVPGGGVADVHVVFDEPAPVVEPPAKQEPVLVPILAPSPPPVASDRVSDSRRTWTSLGLGAGALVAVGAGFALGLAGSAERDDADQYRARMQQSSFSCQRAGTLCDDYDSARSSAQRLEAASTSMFVVGGALAGAALASWLLWPMRVAPVANARGGGAAALFRF